MIKAACSTAVIIILLFVPLPRSAFVKFVVVELLVIHLELVVKWHDNKHKTTIQFYWTVMKYQILARAPV